MHIVLTRTADGGEFHRHKRGAWFKDWAAIEEAVRHEFNGSEWSDVACVEPEEGEGDLITLDGKIVARCNFIASSH